MSARAAAAAREIEGVRITHPDKKYWPEDGYTKGDLIAFYAAVWDRLRPYVDDRLLSLERCPDGMRGGCFFQKEAPQGLPADTPTHPIQHAKKVTNYVVGGRLETQLSLANLGCIAIHVWGSRASAPRQPDWVCFDLDPSTERFEGAIEAAVKVREALDALELESFPKTSGGKGLHVFVPIKRGPDADEVLLFAETLGARLAQAFPKLFTVESRIASRKGRVYLDPFRNGFAQTVVAPYSVRRRAGAPYSKPLAWKDVKPGLQPGKFTLGTHVRDLAKTDPWRDFWKTRQTLTRAMGAVRRL
ncbi:MAG TPA: non-homologous end-joining DNA ligase [Thermoanaerobaculia bacterium]|nr:non-homologous end-joining DNA ligase [Thermoanaerobaculia bacterium]